jgi:hypothetical protein
MSFPQNCRLARAALLCGLVILNALGRDAGSANQAASPSTAMFFHGTVTQINSTHVTVSRAIVGRAPETHTFLTNKKTKMNRILHIKAKVTVRYEHLPEGDIALDIQVHPRPAHMQFSDPSGAIADGDI